MLNFMTLEAAAAAAVAMQFKSKDSFRSEDAVLHSKTP